MNPAIIFHPDEPNSRYIVDLDCVSTVKDRLINIPTVHYLAAVDIQNLKPGQYQARIVGSLSSENPPLSEDYLGPPQDSIVNLFSLWRANFAVPQPAVYSQYRLSAEPHTIKRFSDRSGREMRPDGITRSAAEALLRLSISHNNPEVRQALGKWRFDGPAIEGVEAPWDDWNFIISWHWSKWENDGIAKGKSLTIRDRWREAVSWGFPYKERAFSQRVTALRLNRTN